MLRTGYGATSKTGLRLTGSEGTIEVGGFPAQVQLFNKTSNGWQNIEHGETEGDLQWVARGVLDLVDALKNHCEPELAARRALSGTELIFATYESSRRRGRIDLPLTIDDSPFLAMVESGIITT